MLNQGSGSGSDHISKTGFNLILNPGSGSDQNPQLCPNPGFVRPKSRPREIVRVSKIMRKITGHHWRSVAGRVADPDPAVLVGSVF